MRALRYPAEFHGRAASAFDSIYEAFTIH